MNTTTVPTWQDCVVLRKGQADALAERLKARGYLAATDVSGGCSTVDGEHIHLASVVVRLTPAQAERLANG